MIRSALIAAMALSCAGAQKRPPPTGIWRGPEPGTYELEFCREPCHQGTRPYARGVLVLAQSPIDLHRAPDDVAVPYLLELAADRDAHAVQLDTCFWVTESPALQNSMIGLWTALLTQRKRSAGALVVPLGSTADAGYDLRLVSDDVSTGVSWFANGPVEFPDAVRVRRIGEPDMKACVAALEREAERQRERDQELHQRCGCKTEAPCR